MDPLSLAVLALSWFFTITIVILLFRRWRRRDQMMNYPPGPKPWPVIGNLNLIGPTPHLSLHKLSQEHGPLIQLRFGSVPVVVASSAQMAKEILKTNDKFFSSRPQTAAGRLTNHNYKDVTWAPYGPYWRLARKIILSELISPKKLAFVRARSGQEVRAFLTLLHVLAGSGRPVTLKAHLSGLTFTVISRVALGKKYFTEPKSGPGPKPRSRTMPGPGSGKVMFTLEEVQEMLEERMELNGVLNLGDWIRWASFLDLQGYEKRMRALSEKLDKFLDLVLDDHTQRKKEEAKDFVAKDIVDATIQLADDPALEGMLDDDSLKGLTQDLISGGTDTTATNLEWAMSELLKHPNIMDKAKEELDKVVGRDRWVEETDFHKLPFLEAIVKETLRLHPPSTMLPPRIASQDCLVAGHNVPKGTVAFINVWSIGRDPAIWGDEAHEFRPERFMNGCDVDVNGHSFELLPFGSGRRMCPGYPLGLRMSYSVLGNMLHGFDWRLAGGVKGGGAEHGGTLWASHAPKIFP